MLPDPSSKETGIAERAEKDSSGSRQDSRRPSVDVNVALRRAYDTTVKEEIPDSLLSLLEKLN
jgi:hypothetical protein